MATRTTEPLEEAFFLVDDREVVVTNAWHVACDGGGGALGHPVEYMTLEKAAAVVCKYFGRRYLHASHREAGKVRAEGQPYSAPVAA